MFFVIFCGGACSVAATTSEGAVASAAESCRSDGVQRSSGGNPAALGHWHTCNRSALPNTNGWNDLEHPPKWPIMCRAGCKPLLNLSVVANGIISYISPSVNGWSNHISSCIVCEIFNIHCVSKNTGLWPVTCYDLYDIIWGLSLLKIISKCCELVKLVGMSY